MSSTEAETEQAVETEVETASEVEAEPDDGDDDDATEAEPDLIDVVINGERQRVTRDEAANGYQRCRIIAAKRQELAKRRKSLAAEAQAITAEREKYAQALEVMAGQLSADQEPDWSQLHATKTRLSILQQKDLWRDKQERLAKVQQEQARLYQEQSAKMQKQAEQELLQQQSCFSAFQPGKTRRSRRKKSLRLATTQRRSASTTRRSQASLMLVPSSFCEKLTSTTR